MTTASNALRGKTGLRTVSRALTKGRKLGEKALHQARAALYESRFAVRSRPPARPAGVPVASSLLNNDMLPLFSPITNDLAAMHPDLHDIMRRNKGIRKWEYGMMLHGLPPLRDRKVLDIGSGPSLLPVYLARRQGAHVTVLDLPSPYTVDAVALSRRLARAGVNLQFGDMRAMPFEDGAFDAVISISVIEHLSHSADHMSFPGQEDFFDQTRTVLREMYRVTRPGGWIYLTTEAYLEGRVQSDAWAKKLVDGHPYGAYPLERIEDIFLATLRDLGGDFPYPICLDKSLLANHARYASYRNRFMTAFNLFVQKPYQQ